MTPNTHLRNNDLQENFMSFAHEFNKNFFAHLDRRFYAILLISIFLHLSVVFYFVANPPAGELSQSEIEKMQKRFADLVLDKPDIEQNLAFSDLALAPDTPDAETETAEPLQGDAKGSGTASTTGAETAQENTEIAAAGEQGEGAPTQAAARRTRESIRDEVKTQGLLGLLSSTSGKAAGEEVSDVLGEGVPGGGINEKLANVSGTQRPGSETAGSDSGGGIRGARTTEGGGEDLKVGSLGKSGTSNQVKRSGNLEVQEATPLIEIEEGEVLQGARDPDAVAAVVHSHNSAIQYCYQRELKRDPDLRGKIVIRFKITPQGTVNSTTILSSTLNNDRVEKCIVSRINRWNDFGAIDPSKGDTTIRQVYTFGY